MESRAKSEPTSTTPGIAPGVTPGQALAVLDQYEPRLVELRHALTELCAAYDSELGRVYPTLDAYRCLATPDSQERLAAARKRWTEAVEAMRSTEVR